MCKEQYAKQIDKAIFPGTQGGPLMHIIAAKAVAFELALQPEFKTYCQQIVSNAKALAAALVEYGIQLVSGGTDNHLMLIDLRGTGKTGKVAETLLHSRPTSRPTKMQFPLILKNRLSRVASVSERRLLRRGA